jgi:hypothetical protein
MQMILHSSELRNAVKLFKNSGSSVFENALGSFGLSKSEERAVTETFLQKELTESSKDNVVSKAYWL